MAEFGRAPYPTVLEKLVLLEREAVDPVCDKVDEEKELPRVCTLVVLGGGREEDTAFFGSMALVVFGRVA